MSDKRYTVNSIRSGMCLGVVLGMAFAHYSPSSTLTGLALLAAFVAFVYFGARGVDERAAD